MMAKVTDSQQVLLICILLAGICCISLALECMPADGYESCACYRQGVNNSREYVNLLPLRGNSSIPSFTTRGNDQWFYSYSPCAEFSEFVGENNTGYIPCVNTSVARWTNLSTHRCDGLGNKASGTFKKATIEGLVKSNLTLNFENKGIKPGAVVISLICDDSMPENGTVFKYIGTEKYQPIITYYLSLTSKCCCPGKCGLPPVPARSTAIAPTQQPTQNPTDCKPKKWETILVAVCGVLLLLIVVGFVYLCCPKKKEGYEAV